MDKLKLTIDLLPKGAWGNDLSKRLPKKDWDTLREFVLRRANGKCEICGFETSDLDAHEEWDFDTQNKTQTLKSIKALCTKCHGVKHFRNSKRLGFGEEAKKHFLEVNQCSELDFAGHLMQAERLFNERNEIYYWKMKLNLDKFKNITVPDLSRQKIVSPYSEEDLDILRNQTDLLPRILDIEVDNYTGEIVVKSDISNKIVWYVDDKEVKKEYTFALIFKSRFSVTGIKGKGVWFTLYGDYGKRTSKVFKLEDF